MEGREVISKPSTTATWGRFIPHRFSLRAIFVLITLAAILSWWMSGPSKGVLTEWQASRVKLGMTPDEVRAITVKLKSSMSLLSDPSMRVAI